MDEICNALSKNRDENSITAELFLNGLFPSFKKKNNFKIFITQLLDTENGCYDDAVFQCGKLFVELRDLAFNRINDYKIPYNKIDGTEFDVVIYFTCNDNKYFWIFEMKAFSNIKIDELKRQEKKFKYLKGWYGLNNIIHTCIIAESYRNNSKRKDSIINNINNIKFISYTKIKEYFDFIKEEFPLNSAVRKLPCCISKSNFINEKVPSRRELW